MMRSWCAAGAKHEGSAGGRSRRLVRALALAATVAVAQGGCAAVRRSEPDLDALERERAAIEAKAQRACEGVPSGDLAPGVSGLGVVRIAVLERPVRRGGDVVEGAAAVIKTGGRSFQSMDLLMRCRAARAAVVQDAADPLAVAGASVHVYRDDGEAVVVQIRSRRVDAAREIVRRLRLQVPDIGEPTTPPHEASQDADAQGVATPRSPPSRSSRTTVPPRVGPARPTWQP